MGRLTQYEEPRIFAKNNEALACCQNIAKATMSFFVGVFHCTLTSLATKRAYHWLCIISAVFWFNPFFVKKKWCFLACVISICRSSLNNDKWRTRNPEPVVLGHHWWSKRQSLSSVTEDTGHDTLWSSRQWIWDVRTQAWSWSETMATLFPLGLTWTMKYWLIHTDPYNGLW